MSGQLSDHQRLRSEKHFFDELETGIRTANQEIISSRIPDLNRDAIHALAVMVGRLRANYLEVALQIGRCSDNDDIDPSMIADLSNRRQMFDELRDAYDALRRAVERGYIAIDGIGD